MLCKAVRNYVAIPVLARVPGDWYFAVLPAAGQKVITRRLQGSGHQGPKKVYCDFGLESFQYSRHHAIASMAVYSPCEIWMFPMGGFVNVRSQVYRR